MFQNIHKLLNTNLCCSYHKNSKNSEYTKEIHGVHELRTSLPEENCEMKYWICFICDRVKFGASIFIKTQKPTVVAEQENQSFQFYDGFNASVKPI